MSLISIPVLSHSINACPCPIHEIRSQCFLSECVVWCVCVCVCVRARGRTSVLLTKVGTSLLTKVGTSLLTKVGASLLTKVGTSYQCITNILPCLCNQQHTLVLYKSTDLLLSRMPQTKACHRLVRHSSVVVPYMTNVSTLAV